jgi:1-acyl-sn-glycerol-3-phosphate acyltransferase
MITANYLKKIRLVTVPNFQKLIGHFVLTPNYRWFSKVDIRLEGAERIPRDRTVIFAMNHTDRYNYWPFQYKLWKMKGFPYTTVWVKGAYYRNRILARFFNMGHLIPVPSMKYLIEELYTKKFKRRIDTEEYRLLKDFIEGKDRALEMLQRKSHALATLIYENFAESLQTTYESIMAHVADLSRRALLEKRLNLIIFPEGTRARKLGTGRTGLAEVALHTEAPILPVGCNNSDKLYPGNLPFARSGRVVYRVGELLDFENRLKHFRLRDEFFRPFTHASRQCHRERLEALTALVMEHISRLVDERHRVAAGA